MQIYDSVIIISGASAGIGAALAVQLSQQGARLVLIARRQDALTSVHQQLTNPAQHHIIVGDIGQRDTMDRAVATAMEHFGRIDYVVCNAGVGLSAPVSDINLTDLQMCIQTNVYGVLHMIQASLPQLRHQGRGAYVVISSVVGVQGLPYSGGYCATKGAVERLCDALRIELLGTSIGVSVVRPGTVRSEFRVRRHGADGEVRHHIQPGIDAEVAAQRIIAAMPHNRRYVYTRWQDRLMLWGSQIVAPLADRVLSQRITWKK